MNVLVVDIKSDLSGLNIGPNLLQSGNNGLRFVLRDDALPGQHRHMGDAAVYILVIHSLVEEDGGVILLDRLVHFFFKSSAP